MQSSYIPKATISDFCEGLHLCSVRQDLDGNAKLGIKNLTGDISEEDLGNIINLDNYNGKKIIRVYSSGHIFLNEDKTEVFLITTEKNGETEHQFTLGSPLEEENKDAIFIQNGIYTFDLEKVRNNARIRTQHRTGIKILEEYNKKPLVDWGLIENKENGETYYKLICFMYFIIKKYEGNLGGTEGSNPIDGRWYKIDNLKNTANITTNTYIVSKKAQELLNKQDKLAIICDFSKTLTGPTNPSTWSVFAKSGLLGEEYTQERNHYYNKYHDFELQGDVEKTKQWWGEHLQLFVKYGLTKGLIDKVTKDYNYFSTRNGLKDFFNYSNKNNIDFFIISSGVSNFIKSFLKGNNINLDNIKIYSNKLIFDDNDKLIGFNKNFIITTLNKYNHNIELEYYKKVILLGDDESDLKMYNGDCLKIGFCDENILGYDIYLGEEGVFQEVIDIINKF